MSDAKIAAAVQATPRYLCQLGWDDAPHLSEQAKADMLAETPEYLRAARSKGDPSMGEGAIYTMPIEELLVDPFPIPSFWPRAYAFDPSWNRTAALWGAWDPADDCLYLYSEHLRGNAEPMVHAAAIKSRGEWMHGVIDPASESLGNAANGEKFLSMYQEEGLHLSLADNAVETGIAKVDQRQRSGRLKVFRNLKHYQAERRLYRRQRPKNDPLGNPKIVKRDDDLMDCERYLVASGRAVAKPKPLATVGTGSNVRGPGDRKAGY